MTTQLSQTSPTLQSIQQVNFMEAPLVHLVDTDPAKLNPEELHQYLTTLRSIRGSVATTKAATKRGATSTAASKGLGVSKGIDLGGLL